MFFFRPKKIPVLTFWCIKWYLVWPKTPSLSIHKHYMRLWLYSFLIYNIYLLIYLYTCTQKFLPRNNHWLTVELKEVKTQTLSHPVIQLPKEPPQAKQAPCQTMNFEKHERIGLNFPWHRGHYIHYQPKLHALLFSGNPSNLPYNCIKFDP